MCKHECIYWCQRQPNSNIHGNAKMFTSDAIELERIKGEDNTESRTRMRFPYDGGAENCSVGLHYVIALFRRWGSSGLKCRSVLGINHIYKGTVRGMQCAVSALKNCTWYHLHTASLSSTGKYVHKLLRRPNHSTFRWKALQKHST